MNLIFGAGGVAREVAWLLHEVIGPSQGGRLEAFVTADDDWSPGTAIDGVPVLRDADVLDVIGARKVSAYLALGLPEARRRVAATLADSDCFTYPSLLHPSVTMDRRPDKVRIGAGVIIYAAASITTDVLLGDFVHVNPGATVAHGARIGAFSTICPGANISGNATIGQGCFVGAGVVVKEGVRVADNCVLGAGTVVVKDITEAGTWVGIPARKLPR